MAKRPRRVTDRALSRAQAGQLEAVLLRTHPFDPPEAECSVGLDGADWIVEDVGRSGYHVVRRWSPDSGGVRTLGRALLDLTGWQFKPIA